MTLKEYKQTPSTVKILSEIVEPVPPYIKKENIEIEEDSEYGDYSFSFKDEFDNNIKVTFTEYNDNCFEAEFSVNGDAYDGIKTTMSHYFKILSTVIEIINVFLDEYDPNTIIISGIGTTDLKSEQKNRIYLTYVKNLIKDNEYIVANKNNGFLIQKTPTTNKLEEFWNKIKK